MFKWKLVISMKNYSALRVQDESQCRITSNRSKLFHVEKEVTNKTVTENSLDKYLSSAHMSLVCSVLPGIYPSEEHPGFRWKRIVSLSTEYFHRLLGVADKVWFTHSISTLNMEASRFL
jgi:hypothetical protein